MGMLSRRQVLKQMGNGFGMLAASSLLAEASPAGALAPRAPHFPPKAKRLLFLYLNGGPSHVDTFDPKPMLSKYDAQPVPDAFKQPDANAPLLGSPFTFRNYGHSGLPVSDLFPKLSTLIDDFCVIRSMHTDNPGHEIGMLRMNCGHLTAGHPSMGSWITYGLGSENQNLPGFVVLCPGLPVMGAPLWSCAYLPGVYQGTHIRNRDEVDPAKLIQYLRTSRHSLDDQRSQLDLLGKLNWLQMNATDQGDQQLEASIQSMEIAYRMQTEALDAFDIRKESQATRERYGDHYFARGCLMARRLLERGVRVAQVYFGNRNPWDSHSDIFDHRKLAQMSDGPMTALIQDLKTLGLLQDTIVLIGGEFGRTPSKDGDGRLEFGRGHNHRGFTTLVAGGGFKGGLAYGATDDLGFKAIENPVHVNDLHATVLHQLGFDHTKLTFRYSGRDFRLTDVGGRVVTDIIG